MSIKSALLFLSALPLIAQSAPATQHSVTLTWTDDANPAGTTYTVYRSAGLCSGAPTFSKLATAITDKTYLDTSVTSGNWCFSVTATSNGMESAQSQAATAPVPSFPPQNVTVVAK